MLLVFPPVEMLPVNLQLVVAFGYNRDVLHGYVDQNFPWLTICQEIVITAVFNVVA